MEAVALEMQEFDDVREARRAGELILTAVDVLREEVWEDGAMARALSKLSRVAHSFSAEQSPHQFETTVAVAHHALAHALAIGRAVNELLDARGQQCLETLGSAQRVLYPVARRHGVQAPPPLPEKRPVSAAILERRTSPRVELDIDVSFVSESNFFQGFSEDLSDGGLFVATYDLQPIGTKVDVEFTLPTGHIVKVTGEVRWLRDLREDSPGVSPGIGIRFLDLPPEDERAIHEFVRARSPMFFDD